MVVANALKWGVHIMVIFLSHITATSQWARWRLKSPDSRLFTEPFIQAQIKKTHQSSASLAFGRGIHQWPVNSPHKGPVARKMFRFDDVLWGHHGGMELDANYSVPDILILECRALE